MNKYNEVGYIYKLECSETDNCYYGSTFNPSVRIYSHRSYNNFCASKSLIKPKMKILETKHNITRRQLKLIEKYYILNNKCVNKNVPMRTRKEAYKDKIIKNPNYLKEIYIKNGGAIRNDVTRKYCECGGVYVQRNLKSHLQTLKHKKYIDNI